MKLPNFADVKNRTASLPVVLCTKVQTAQLLTYAEYERKPEDGHRDIWNVLVDLMLDGGWNRIEKHGHRILLIAVIVDAQATLQERKDFTNIATRTGNWSWPDYRKANPRRLLSRPITRSY